MQFRFFHKILGHYYKILLTQISNTSTIFQLSDKNWKGSFIFSLAQIHCVVKKDFALF